MGVGEQTQKRGKQDCAESLKVKMTLNDTETDCKSIVFYFVYLHDSAKLC